MTSPRPSLARLRLRKTIAALALTAVCLSARPAAAEYGELDTAKSIDRLALVTFGTAGAGLSLLSVHYLARGKGAETGRAWVGGLLLADAALLLVSGAVASEFVSKSLQGDRELNILQGCVFGAAAFTAGMGIATLVSRKSPDDVERPVALLTPFFTRTGGGVSLSAIF